MKWIVAILAAALAAAPALAQQPQQKKPASKPSGTTLRKCVDEQGVTQYYDKNPPAGCKDREITEMTTKGVTKKTIAAPPTEEERKARDEEAARRAEEEKRQKEQARKDKALLETYTTEMEIDLARDRNLQAVESSIQSIEVRLKTAKGRNAQFSQQVEGYTKQGKPVPSDLKEDADESQKEVARLQQELEIKNRERDGIRARFDADKQRFRELKSKSDAFQQEMSGQKPAAAPAPKK
jgi:chromosome segregation ATPase